MYITNATPRICKKKPSFLLQSAFTYVSHRHTHPRACTSHLQPLARTGLSLPIGRIRSIERLIERIAVRPVQPCAALCKPKESNNYLSRCSKLSLHRPYVSRRLPCCKPAGCTRLVGWITGLGKWGTRSPAAPTSAPVFNVLCLHLVATSSS